MKFPRIRRRRKGARCARYIIPAIDSMVQANPLKILTKLCLSICYILADHIRPSLLARLPQIPNEIRSKIQRKKQLGELLLIDFWILSLLKAEENYLDLQNIMGNLL